MYRAHLATMTVSVWSPIRRPRKPGGRGAYTITEQEAHAWAQVQDGGDYTQRQLMQMTGYRSTGGVQGFLVMVKRLGLMAVETTRGRHGRTRLTPIPGARIVAGLPARMVQVAKAIAVDVGALAGILTKRPKQREGNVRAPLSGTNTNVVRRESSRSPEGERAHFDDRRPSSWLDVRAMAWYAGARS